MTTYDFWINDLDRSRGGPTLSRSGRGDFANHLGWTLWDFIRDGRAPKDPQYCHVTHLKTVISGDVLAEVFRETERVKKCVLRQSDGTRSVGLIDSAHRYEITFIEH